MEGIVLGTPLQRIASSSQGLVILVFVSRASCELCLCKRIAKESSYEFEVSPAVHD